MKYSIIFIIRFCMSGYTIFMIMCIAMQVKNMIVLTVTYYVKFMVHIIQC